ncbi:hypothetical protein Dimus_018855 [Dionaea muscipula]
MASRTSNSRSGSSSNVVGHVSNCRNCGIRRKIYTSRTDDNSGRRFMQCPRRDCNHFTWIDDLLSDPASEIIRGLLRRINMLEAQLAAGNTHPSEETQQMVADTILAAPVNVGSSYSELTAEEISLSLQLPATNSAKAFGATGHRAVADQFPRMMPTAA